MPDPRDLTLSLGGRWYGTYGCAPCPICQPEQRPTQNALTLSVAKDGRLLLHCKKANCDFRDLLGALGIFEQRACIVPVRTAGAKTIDQISTEKRGRLALEIWNQSVPIKGTAAEVYLRHRGLTCDLPRYLRYHPKTLHGPTDAWHPAMVAMVSGARGPAVHRTWLKPGGQGKADLTPNKTMLGPVAGGAVRLFDDEGPLVVAEGIETALSLASGILTRPFRLWAALSTSGIRSLNLPPVASKLIIATDGDPAGQVAGDALATRADELGWDVSLLPAPEGCDWNDILIKEGVEK